MDKRLLGKCFTFKIAGRKLDVSGVVLSYNDHYTFLREIVDYTAGGYVIFKHGKIEHYFGDSEKRTMKILKLNGYQFKAEPVVPLDNLDSILRFINTHYGLIMLDNRRGDGADVVRYLGQDGKRYLFDELTVAAKWRNKLSLPEKECRFISFDTNYLNALKLITKF